MLTRHTLLFALCMAFSFMLSGQVTNNLQTPTSINTDGVLPDESAILDVQATDRGVLVPRMTTTQRTAIASPATGLLVFDTETGSFWFYDGAAWKNLTSPVKELSDADNDTKIYVEKSPDEDIIRFDLEGEEKMSLLQNMDGHARLEFGMSTNVAAGTNALFSNTTGINNSAYGMQALFSNTTGNDNSAYGMQALYSNTTGFVNTANGRQALSSNTTGSYNTANGAQALSSNTSGIFNTANGAQALFSNISGSHNTANGPGALRSNTTGEYNIALGRNALYSNVANSRSTAIGFSSLYYADDRTTGRETFNTAIGYQALRGSTTAADNTGRYNTAIGDQALYSNTIGYNNTANGRQALLSNTTGDDNTANGGNALYFNTIGDYNTANGVDALKSNTSGYYNTANGVGALKYNTSGYYNTANGYSAGSFNDNNTNCTFIGFDADQLVATDFNNSSALGNIARITASDQVRIGNSTVGSIGGYEPWTDLSDGRFKQNLQEDVPGLGFILKLRPVTYNLDVHGLAAHLQEDRTEDFEKENGEATQKPSALTLQSREAKSHLRRTGFVAQEVEKAAQAVGYDFSGVDKPHSEEGLYGLRYSEFVVPLVKAVQEQQVEIESLKAELAEMKKLKAEIEGIKAMLNAPSTSTDSED